MLTDVLIIGSGPAGYTAAIYAARAGKKVAIITGQQQGGQLIIASFIENYPGFIEPISGPELMDKMRQQAEKMGIKTFHDTVKEVDFSKRPFICIGDSETSYESKTVIIATGANAKWLGVSGETRYRGAGVSACATCDGFFFRDKDIAVIGGGNTAVEEALYLTGFAKSVTLIHRRGELRAEKITQQRLFENPKVNVMWDTKIVEILGDDNRVTELLLENTKTGSQTKKNIDGVFVAIGHRPATSIFKDQLKMDNEGYILTKPGSSATSIEGIFAAGDVCNPKYRQAIVSAGQGCIAAIDADNFLSINN